MCSSPVLALDMALTDFFDPYLDPTTGILRNKVSAWTQADLDKAEADLVLAQPASALARARQLHHHARGHEQLERREQVVAGAGRDGHRG